MHIADTKQSILSLDVCIYVVVIFRVISLMQKLYEGPEELIDVMTSLSVTRESFSAGEHCNFDSLVIHVDILMLTFAWLYI